MLATLKGGFVDADGKAQDGLELTVEVDRDGKLLHLRVDGRGRGIITMQNHSGVGTFRTFGNQNFQITVVWHHTKLRYTLHEGVDVIATGEIPGVSW